MKSTFLSILLGLFLTFANSFNAAADEVTDIVNDVAVKLVQQLPMDKKIALKSLSPDETGLPEDFLRKLTSDLEVALLMASEFEINLINRAAMEDVWQETIEFNNADFGELFNSANADIMLLMSPRAISSGVEVSITAYALTGANVGKTLASSGSILLPINLKTDLGIDVTDLNKQMMQVLEEIQKVGETGGLISSPNTYAEFYHNARLLQQRGEVDQAIRNYEQALSEGYLFIDPLLDLLILSNSRYGKKGTQLYFEKKVKPIIPNKLVEFAELYLNNIHISDIYSLSDISEQNDLFLPNLLLWVTQNSSSYMAETINFTERKYVDDYLFMRIAQIVIGANTEGKLQSNFIDKVRASDFADIKYLNGILEKLNRFEYQVFPINYKKQTSTEYYEINCPGKNVDPYDWIYDPNRTPGDYKSSSPPTKVEDPTFVGGRPYCQSDIDYQLIDYSTGGYRADRLQLNEGGESCSYFPFQPRMDRILYGDICGETTYYIMGRLLITDQVDTSERIIVKLEDSGFDGVNGSYETDISVDGTFISAKSAPIASSMAEGNYFPAKYPNKWFWAPGLLQSSLQGRLDYSGEGGSGRPFPRILSISYTDIYGQKKKVKKGMVSSDVFNGNVPYDIGNPVSENTIGSLIRYAPKPPERSLFFEDWKYEWSGFNTAIENTKKVFETFDPGSRKNIQKSLENFNLYQGLIDGEWGYKTEFAIRNLYKTRYGPGVGYVDPLPKKMTSFILKGPSKSEFVQFWNELINSWQLHQNLKYLK